MSGAAGFIGSHFCDRLVAEGHTVVGLDNLMTGSLQNLKQLEGDPKFSFQQVDVTKPFDMDGPVDSVLHLASLASPRDYLRYPIETLESGSTATRNLLEIALRF